MVLRKSSSQYPLQCLPGCFQSCLEEWWNRACFKMPQSSKFLLSWIHAPGIATTVWLISWLLKKLILIIFACVLIPYNGEENFQRSLLCRFWCHSSLFKASFLLYKLLTYLFSWPSETNLSFVISFRILSSVVLLICVKCGSQSLNPHCLICLRGKADFIFSISQGTMLVSFPYKI